MAAYGPKGAATVNIQARLAINGMGALLAAAKAGPGAALVPQRLAAQALANGELVHVLPKYFYEGDGFFIVYPSRRHPPASLRVFLAFVMDQVDAINQESVSS